MLIIVTADGTEQAPFEEAVRGRGCLAGEGLTFSSPVNVVPWTSLSKASAECE